MASSSLLSFCASLTLAIIPTLVPAGYGNAEGDALISLKSSLSDPNNVLASWDPSLVDPCTWFHVTCNQNNEVTRVDLGRENLSGHLVPELKVLQNLQYLSLFGNKLDGSIPKEIADISSLLSRDLSNNDLCGMIPPGLQHVPVLHLGNNPRLGKPCP
eukprot:XP_015570728.1 leucine-rich repeat protein 1 [Ricinus communis]